MLELTVGADETPPFTPFLPRDAETVPFADWFDGLTGARRQYEPAA